MRTPVPNWKGIPKEPAANTVTTVTMTDEQRDWMNNLPRQSNPKPTKAWVKKEPLPIEPDQEVEDLSRPMLHPHVNKEFIEAAFAEGKTAAQIERENGLPLNTLQNRLKVFGIVNPNAKNRSPELKAAIAQVIAVKAERVGQVKTEQEKVEVAAKICESIQAVTEGLEEPLKELVDMVNSPSHYTAGGIEVIDYLQGKLTVEEFAGFCKGNVIKYLSREKHKGGIESLLKAQWYLNRLLDAE